MSESSQERRRFIRVKFDNWVEITSGSSSWRSPLIDISLKGLLIKQPERWPDDAPESLKAHIKLDKETTIAMKIRLAHSEQDVIGFECVAIDIDSITALRRLMELNSGQPELLERELSLLG